MLTKGSLLTDNPIMQRVWALTQCIAIDTSVVETITRTFRYRAEGEKVKMWLYALYTHQKLWWVLVILRGCTPFLARQYTTSVGLMVV